MDDPQRGQDRPPCPARNHRHDGVVTVEFEPVRQADILTREMCADLATHVMPRGVLDHRQGKQLRGHVTPRIDRPLWSSHDEGFGQQRVNLHPFAASRLCPQIGRHHHVECAAVELVDQTVAGAGFQQELRAFQLFGHGLKQARRHLGVEILDHPQPQRRQRGHVGHRQFGPRLGSGIEDGLGMAAEHAARGGQTHRARAAVKQHRPERGLKAR